MGSLGFTNLEKSSPQPHSRQAKVKISWFSRSHPEQGNEDEIEISFSVIPISIPIPIFILS